MRSDVPKPLHSVCGLPLTAHVIRACAAAGLERVVVVVGHGAAAVQAGLGQDVEYVVQQTQRGTGDAVGAAQSLLYDWQGPILVLAGDVPLLRADTLRNLVNHHTARGAAVTLLTAILDDATGYGRVVRDPGGRVTKIVEEKDASEAERAIREWNPSIYAFESSRLWSALSALRDDNAQAELYLTDTIRGLRESGASIEAVPAADATEVLGVNTRIELAAAASVMRQRKLESLMLSGVSVTDPATTYVDVDVRVGCDSVLEPQTFLLGATRVGEHCVIGPFTRIETSEVGNGVRVLASQLVQTVVEDGARIGPFANLRPGTHLEAEVKIGDFVEVKNARVGAGAHASHLAYIGDADVGAGANIGAGTITCNYDGHEKHHTSIGARAFIGSNATLVAPVNIGADAFVAAASAITEDVPDDALAIARSRTTIKAGWAARRRQARRADSKHTGREPS